MAKHSKKLDKTQQNKFQKLQSGPKPQPDELEDDVPDFPRGGGKTLSKEELEEVKAEFDAKFKSKQRILKKKWKDRSKNSGQQSIEDELGSLSGNGITEKLPRFANKITLKVSPILSEVESRSSIPALEVPLDDDTETTSVDDTKVEMASKGNQRTKKKEKEKREREIIAGEERLLDKDLPRTPDEFEKLVRSSPNSSFVWIKYMGFMLSLSDIEKARLIAERALRTINIREESEKLNIWVAYFNLENEYGDPPEDAVVKLFQRALQYCDPKKVHLALLGMYERTEQHKLADELLDKMLQKFKHSCKVWLRRIQRLLKQNQDGIQSVVKRALICLPRHNHINFISQTAILEFKCGVPDRGRSMFEGMLREYPKRTDLWSVYLDQEIRLGDVDMIHAVFERAISMSLPPKKMKFLFKKYLEFKKSRGDEEQIEYVKRKALEYVETTVG